MRLFPKIILSVFSAFLFQSVAWSESQTPFINPPKEPETLEEAKTLIDSIPEVTQTNFEAGRVPLPLSDAMKIALETAERKSAKVAELITAREDSLVWKSPVQVSLNSNKLPEEFGGKESANYTFILPFDFINAKNASKETGYLHACVGMKGMCLLTKPARSVPQLEMGAPLILAFQDLTNFADESGYRLKNTKSMREMAEKSPAVTEEDLHAGKLPYPYSAAVMFTKARSEFYLDGLAEILYKDSDIEGSFKFNRVEGVTLWQGPVGTTNRWAWDIRCTATVHESPVQADSKEVVNYRFLIFMDGDAVAFYENMVPED